MITPLRTSYHRPGNISYNTINVRRLNIIASRYLEKPVEIRRGHSDLVVECKFHASRDASFGSPSEAFCFGVVTYTKPLALSTCSSVPSEFNLENAFEFHLTEYTDVDTKRKRRRKRRADEDQISRRFWARQIMNATRGGRTVDEEVQAVARAIVNNVAGTIADATNSAIYTGNQVRGKSFYTRTTKL